MRTTTTTSRSMVRIATVASAALVVSAATLALAASADAENIETASIEAAPDLRSVAGIVSYAKSIVASLEQVLLEAGSMGPVYVFCLYMVSTVFMLPLWGFHMTCGYVYGTLGSSLLISVTQSLAAGVAFSVSRHVVRPYIKGFLERKYGNKYTAIDGAVGKDGLRITILLRLSPIIPFGLNNYLCGCTDMKLWEFVVGTWVGVLPGTTVYCHMGAMGKVVSEGGTSVVQKALIGVGFAAALYVIHLINKLATDALREAGIDDEGKAKGANKKKN